MCCEGSVYLLMTLIKDEDDRTRQCRDLSHTRTGMRRLGTPGRAQPDAGSSERPGCGYGPGSENHPPISPPGLQKPGGVLRFSSSQAGCCTVWLGASPGVGGSEAPSEMWHKATPGAKKATVVTAARTGTGRKQSGPAASGSDSITHEAIFLEK